jgi:hypothetical protein
VDRGQVALVEEIDAKADSLAARDDVVSAAPAGRYAMAAGVTGQSLAEHPLTQLEPPGALVQGAF